MSSKITVIFQHHSGMRDEFTQTFHIRHLRNYRRNAHGGMELDSFGGYTVLSEDGTGELFVAKCNPRTDKFNRHEGLNHALKAWMKRRKCEYMYMGVNSIEPNLFVATFAHIENDYNITY